MKEAHILRIVVASPSDVQPERDLLPGIIDELNRGIAADRGVRLELSRWETDAYPGFHPEGPQGLIDPILRIEDCDILIGIFWKRFGTPVSDTKSGTEHELKLAYEAWKQNGRPQIMVYFCQKPYTPKSRMDIDQWGRVLEFKEVFPKEGLWWNYDDTIDFERQVRNHLSNFIRGKFPVSTNQHNFGNSHTLQTILTVPDSLQPARPHTFSGPFQQYIDGLNISNEIRQSARNVLMHSEYPRWMSIAGKLVKNPLWEGVKPKACRQIIEKYPLDGPSPPVVMHLDILLIRCNDDQRRGRIYTYYSADWGTNLIPFRQRLPDDNPDRRRELNASHLARHWPVPSDSILVTPLEGKYAISVKQHVKYKDLIVYIFEFCSVEFTKLPDLSLLTRLRAGERNITEGAWLDLGTLRSDRKAWSVNGDVIRALHELFTTSLGPLKSSLPEGFI